MSAPLLVFRIGYMADYEGLAPIFNGGSWVVEHGEAGEMWNFRVEDEKCYGYVMSQNFSGVDLKFIDQQVKQADEVEGIDVVFIAKKPKVGQVVVGWYKNATVFHKHYETRPRNEHEIEDEDIYYLCEVDAENAFLLPEEERTFSVPYAPAHGKGFPGMSNVWYPDPESENHKVAEFIEQLRKYIDSAENEIDLDHLQQTKTESLAQVKIRLTQQKFRNDLLEFWKCCAVTELDIHELLKASHIKPWKDSNNDEKQDVYNGLLLSPALDALFDRGYISFSDDGTVLVSSELRGNHSQAGLPKNAKLECVHKEHKQYLKYHRDNVFRGS